VKPRTTRKRTKLTLEALPRSILSRGQFSVACGSEALREKLLRLMEKTGTTKMSTAVWIAIDHYLECPRAEGSQR